MILCSDAMIFCNQVLKLLSIHGLGQLRHSSTCSGCLPTYTATHCFWAVHAGRKQTAAIGAMREMRAMTTVWAADYGFG
jgi:hypothetical protein